MTDYIMDLRNMTIGFVCFSFMGALIFLFLRHIQKRNGNDMREKMIVADHPEVIYRPFNFETHYESFVHS